MSRPADEAPRRRERAADVVDLPEGLEKKATRERKSEVVDLPKASDSATKERKPESGSSRQSRSRRRPRRKPQRSPKPSVERVMLVSREGDVTQIAVLEEGQIVEHYVTRPEDRSIAGNIYLGNVQNVLPGMEASFIDIGESRNGVLYAGEVGIAATTKATRSPGSRPS